MKQFHFYRNKEVASKPVLTRLFFIWLMLTESLPLTAQATLCQQYASQTADITIGAPMIGGIQSSTFLSSAPGGGSFQNVKIRINGVLKVDIPLTLNNCTVELEEGALIVTDGAVSIHSTNSRYYACSQMWSGFLIKINASIALLWGEIEDAEAALTLDDGAAASIAGMLFDRNHIGIRNGSATAGPVAVNVTFFGGNTFDCTSALNQPFHTGLSPAWTGTGYCGIYMNTAVTSIASMLATSGFQRMHFGIVGVNADISVSACNFQNMINLPINNPINGIRTTGGALTTAFCQFSNMTSYGHGIWAEGTELDIHDNIFDIVGRSGITSSGNLLTDFILIRNNTCILQNNMPFASGGMKFGINVERNSRSGVANPALASLDISYNTITLQGGTNTNYQQRGINVTAPNPATDIGRISNNIVNGNATTIHRQNGIEVHAGVADRFHIENNTVTYSDANNMQHGARWAISMLYGTGVNHLLMHNISLAQSGNNSNTGQGYCGIHLEDMPNVTMCSNSVNNFEQGIHFFGNCTGLGFWENTMNAHFNSSVRLQNNSNTAVVGYIGTHIRTGNRWLQNSTARNNSTWPNMPLNRLVVPANITPSHPGTFAPLTFGLIQAGPETSCMLPPANEPESGGELTGFDHWVKDGAVGVNQVSAWEARRGLIYKLLRFPALKDSDAGMTAFFNAKANSNEGKFAEADFQYLQAIQTVTVSQENTTSGLIQQRQTSLEQVGAWDIANGTSYPTSAPTAQQIASKKNLLDGWKENFGLRLSAKQNFLIQKQAAINQAKSSVNAINPSSIQELNWKTIQQARLDLASGITHSAAVLDELRDVAAQCPDAAGSSAIAALFMLPLEEIGALLPEEQVGLEGSCNGSPRHSQASDAEKKISLSPNPVQDRLMVDLPFRMSGVWELWNVHGSLTLNMAFKETTRLEIDINSLNNGIYMFRITNIRGEIFAEKLVISK